MPKTIKVDPITRIEGHMKVETELENGFVSNARVSGEMFRGFETFLLNRHPFDAARIAQRVCGVCHEVHGIASIKAIEELYGIEPPKNGKIVRDLILGLHLVTDHLLHFYHLSLPDYIDFTKILEYKGNDPFLNNVKTWVVKSKPKFILERNEGRYLSNTSQCLGMTANYLEALKIRSEGGSGIAILGAKAPFAHAILPGGIVNEINLDKLAKYQEVLERVYSFVINSYIPDVMNVAAAFGEYFDIGVAHNNFFTNTTFDLLGKPLFNAGVSINGVMEQFSFSNVEEKTGSSFYSSGMKPDPKKDGAYSWIKSPRYKNMPMEVGPLARMIVNQDKDFSKALITLGQLKNTGDVKNLKSSTMGRIVARAYESKLICEHLERLIQEFKVGEPTYVDADLSKKVNGKGTGLSLAARGALIHQIEASDGKITKYNMIVPSTWNFGPAEGGNRGVVEQALVGTPVASNSKDGIEIGRVIRSFDPCTACAVH